MGKLTIQEIAKILVEKNKLTPKEASQFAVSMFELIQQRLDSEELVKIKGLGTFKMIRVEARESVSVRTGERVMIDSHAKITFTPDTMMKELVNKPFSQFETVVLNDGIEFEDLADDLTEEEQMDQDQENEESTIAQPLLDVVDNHSAMEGEKESVAEEPLQEESLQEEPQTEKPQMKEPQPEEPQPEGVLSFYEEEEESSSWKKTLGYALLTLLLMAASAYGGYWYGQRTANAVSEGPVTETPEVTAVDSIPDLPNDTIAIAEEPVAEQPTVEQPVAEQPKQEVRQEQKAEEEPFWKKYEAMDARVRTGAYHIVGTDHEVKARKGETLSRIARHELGEGMSCYIEVYNDLKPNTPLQEGQIIKIPKLKWKKRRSNN